MGRLLAALIAAGVIWQASPDRAAGESTDVSAPAAPTAVFDSTAPLIVPIDSSAQAGGVTDDPAARALYTQMVEALRKADTLYFESEYSIGVGGPMSKRCTYKIWLKKPNYVRLEASRDGEAKGVLVGNGGFFWKYWPAGRPQYAWEKTGEAAEEYERTRFTSYMRQRSPLGMHSVSHEVNSLGAGMSMQIVDTSTFHGYTDSLQQYLDGVELAGSERIGDENCDVIHLSFMKGQREWFLWISKRDHLPRLERECVHVTPLISVQERLSNLTLNGKMPTEMFYWKPPAGWVEYRMPPLERSLLKNGTAAPDFDLVASDGSRVRMADLRGKVVWLYVWRAG